MRIRNMTNKTLKVCLYLPDWDQTEDVVKAGKMTDSRLCLEQDDAPEIKEVKTLERKKCRGEKDERI